MFLELTSQSGKKVTLNFKYVWRFNQKNSGTIIYILEERIEDYNKRIEVKESPEEINQMLKSSLSPIYSKS